MSLSESDSAHKCVARLAHMQVWGRCTAAGVGPTHRDRCVSVSQREETGALEAAGLTRREAASLICYPLSCPVPSYPRPTCTYPPSWVYSCLLILPYSHVFQTFRPSARRRPLPLPSGPTATSPPHQRPLRGPQTMEAPPLLYLLGHRGRKERPPSLPPRPLWLLGTGQGGALT